MHVDVCTTAPGGRQAAAGVAVAVEEVVTVEAVVVALAMAASWPPICRRQWIVSLKTEVGAAM